MREAIKPIKIWNYTRSIGWHSKSLINELIELSFRHICSWMFIKDVIFASLIWRNAVCFKDVFKYLVHNKRKVCNYFSHFLQCTVIARKKCMGKGERKYSKGHTFPVSYIHRLYIPKICISFLHSHAQYCSVNIPRTLYFRTLYSPGPISSDSIFPGHF